MSAWMTSNESQTKLATLIAFVIGVKIKGVKKDDDRYKSYSFTESGDELKKVFDKSATVRKIAVELHNLNAFALHERYTGAAEKFDLRPFKMQAQNLEAAIEWVPKISYGYHFGRHMSPGLCQMIKTLQCFIYQCSEGKAVDTPLYKALTKLENSLVYKLLTLTPDYKNAEWE